jgi:hypothetical protein
MTRTNKKTLQTLLLVGGAGLLAYLWWKSKKSSAAAIPPGTPTRMTLPPVQYLDTSDNMPTVVGAPSNSGAMWT